jgi:hypothetical protein
MIRFLSFPLRTDSSRRTTSFHLRPSSPACDEKRHDEDVVRLFFQFDEIIRAGRGHFGERHVTDATLSARNPSGALLRPPGEGAWVVAALHSYLAAIQSAAASAPL